MIWVLRCVVVIHVILAELVAPDIVWTVCTVPVVSTSLLTWWVYVRITVMVLVTSCVRMCLIVLVLIHWYLWILLVTLGLWWVINVFGGIVVVWWSQIMTLGELDLHRAWFVMLASWSFLMYLLFLQHPAYILSLVFFPPQQLNFGMQILYESYFFLNTFFDQIQVIRSLTVPLVNLA